jgi:hypothetical protein
MTGDEVWPPLRPSRINHIHAHALGKQAYYRCRISARVERSWLRISPAPHLPFQVGDNAMFVWLISHQPAVLFSHNKATSPQYSSLRTKQPSTTSQPNRLKLAGKSNHAWELEHAFLFF